MRNQVFSTVHTSDFLLSSQYLKLVSKARNQTPKIPGSKPPNLQDVMCCSYLWAEAAYPLCLANHLWGKIVFFTRGMCCSLCLAAVGNYVYLQHPARCRQTRSHSPLTQEMLFLPSSSGTPFLWPLAHLLPWCLSPVAHNLLVHHDPVFNSLVPTSTPLYSYNPILFSSGFFSISYYSFRPPGRIDLIQACVNKKKKKKRKLPLSFCGNSLLFQAAILVLTSARAKPKCVFSYHCIFIQMKTPFKGNWTKPKQVCFNMCVSGFQIKVSISTS